MMTTAMAAVAGTMAADVRRRTAGRAVVGTVGAAVRRRMAAQVVVAGTRKVAASMAVAGIRPCRAMSGRNPLLVLRHAAMRNAWRHFRLMTEI
jgi:hypothetical protein